MQKFLVLFSCLALSLPVWAAPPALARSYASAKGTTSRPITLHAVVINRGKVKSDKAMVVLTCTPTGAKKSKGEATLNDPLEFSMEVPELEPGESKTIDWATPYQSNSDLKEISGGFRASNIDPTGEKNIQLSGKIQSAR